MERVQTLTSKSLVTAVLAFLLCSCSTKIKPEQLEELKSNEEFDQVIKVERIPDTPKPLKEEQISKKKEDRSHSAKKKKQKKDQLKKTGLENQEVKEVKALEKHLPEIEDSEGFNGRRPIFDPFKVGEKATMTAAFTGIPAGTVEFMVKPFLEVNGERSYNFLARATTNSFF